MNDHIYKYNLENKEMQELNVPHGAEILSFIVQDNIAQMYAFVDKDQHETDRIRIQMKQTGQYAGNFKRENYTFAGTLSFQKGQYILHVFWRRLEKEERNE